jgi:hypothetical protein
MFSKKSSFLNSAFDRIIGSLSIRFSLPIIIVTPVLIGVTASIGFSFVAGQQEIETLVRQVSEKSTNIIELKIQSYLEKPQILMESKLAAVHSGNLKLDNFSELQRSFWYQLQQESILSNIYFSNEKGEFLSVENYNRKVILKIRDESTGAKRNLYQLDSQGNRAKLITSIPYDPRDRPWYKFVKESEKLVWTPIYNDSTTNALTISLAMPILEPKTGKFQGALVTDVTLQELSDYLRKLSISPTGKAFILERSGSLVATSSQEQPVKTVKGKQEQLKVTQSQEPIVQATGQYLSDNKGLEAIESKQQFSFTFRGDTHFVEVTPIQDRQGLNWLLVVVISKADFTKDIYAYTRFTIILGIIIAGGAVILGLLMVHWIDQPIQDLYKAAKAIESDNFDASSLEGVTSRDDEFGELGKVFLAMAQMIYSREQSFKKILNQLQTQNTKIQSSRGLEISHNQAYYWEELLKESQKVRTKFENFPESPVVQNQPKTLDENALGEKQRIIGKS